MIKWINESKGDSPDNRGHYRSSERRFEIHPQYRHTVYPDSYKITDYMGKMVSDPTGIHFRPTSISFDTIRECKYWALKQSEVK